VPLLMLGLVIVPVTPVGAGLTPGDAISVEPNGIPVGETAPFVVMPSGEVAPIVGVGLAIPLTCATAALQMTSAGRAAAISENFIGILILWWCMQCWKSQQRQMFKFLSSPASNFCYFASNLESLRWSASFARESGAKALACG
jgi:hypothetical protein